MIKIVSSNILNAKEDIICHQTNGMAVMGTGIAKQIRDKYPEVFEKYKNYCNSIDLFIELLGKVQPIKCHDGKIVCNLFGQHRYGRDKRYTDYSAVKECLSKIKSYAQNKGLSIALPYNMGCMNAGGDWNIVYKMIEEVFNDYDVTIYKLI